jgi:ribosomal protein L37AE/L43A
MKPRIKPLRILQNEALLRRLPDYHRKRQEIETDNRNRIAGYNGEKRLDYYLSLLPNNEFKIYNDLRLTLQYAFQIDSLIITPFFAAIIEVKNYSGTLYFEPLSGQLIQIHGQKEEVIPNPISQVMRQVSQFQEWLLKEKLPALPIEYFVVITNPSTYIKTEKDNSYIFKRVIHAEKLVDRLMEAKSAYNKQIMWPNQLQTLNKLIFERNTPLENQILSEYGISEKELLKGVQCHFCKSYTLIRKDGRWCCTKCAKVTRTAHIQAITDYFLLISTQITNKKCRDFLNLNSRHTAYRILKSMNLTFEGPSKTRFYFNQNS